MPLKIGGLGAIAFPTDYISLAHKFKAKFRSIEWSVDGMKLHWEKYSGDFIPYNLPELFQRCETQKDASGLEFAFFATQTRSANHCTMQTNLRIHSHIQSECFTKFSKIWRKWSGKLSGVFHINTLTSNIIVYTRKI